MSVELIGRVLQRMKELGLNPRSASLASGLNATAIRDMVQRPGHSPRMDTLKKLASGLRTTPEWLAFGLGEGEELADPDTLDPPVSPLSDFVEATFGGIVEAGALRPVDDIVDPDRGPELVPRDERWPHHPYVIYEVVGDSMNAADPPITAGSRVVTVRTDNPVRPISVRTGDIVVVRRTQAQGALVELSVKEIAIGDTEVRYLPRSTNRRHKPIVVERKLETDDETTVEVLGLVIDVMMRVRRR